MNSTKKFQMEPSDVNVPVVNGSPGAWNYIDGGYGEYFSIHGSFIAGAQGNRLTVWKDGNKLMEVFSSWPCDGYPTWKEDEIFWNDIRLSYKNGSAERIGSLELYEGFRPVACQWSIDATFCVLSLQNTKQNKLPSARTVQIERNGNLKQILAETEDYASKAIGISKNSIALSTRMPTIYDFPGNKMVTLDGGLPAQRIRFAKNDALLFIQTFESISLWDTANWGCIKTIEGPWLNASIAAEDAIIYAIDFEGRLFEIRNWASVMEFREIPAPEPVATVDAGSTIIMASFARGKPLAWMSRIEMERLKEKPF